MAARKDDRKQQLPKLAYTIKEAEQVVPPKKDELYQAIRDGTLRAKKYGRCTLITAAALQEYLDNLPDLVLPDPEAEPADGPQPAPIRKRRLKASAPSNAGADARRA